MSFAERHKRWLLPLLGAGVAAVVWMNFTPKAVALQPRPGPLEAPPIRQAPAPPPDPIGTLDPGPSAEGNADLQALGPPPPASVDPGPLLLAGRQAVPEAYRRPTPPPRLHPDQWQNLLAFPGAVPAPEVAARVLADPPPAPDFIFMMGSRREAWMEGRGYREGAKLRGGYLLQRIAADGIVVSGPAGSVTLPLKSRLAPAPSEKAPLP